MNSAPTRLRLRVRGAVQGVGFRPFVHGLAERYGLSGFVLNDPDGVLAEIEGAATGPFLTALRQEPPPLSRIDDIEFTAVELNGQRGFSIRDSIGRAGRARSVPDAAPCQACLDELFDPTSRFHRYPFVTCTQCGPRFTIVHRLPYDRANTAMAGFAMCSSCEADYRNPVSRRFHAETIACSRCGPQLSATIEDVAAALLSGQIVALKGIGSFHLLCDAANALAVAQLRQRKQRPAKPFAVMVANHASVEMFAAPTPAELALLEQASRPIVLLRPRTEWAASVAPGLDRVGVMLPSSPLHLLLFHVLAGQPAWREAPHPIALVATSANAGGEPLIIDNEDALKRLSGIADLIVTHDRPILSRADDSVMRVIDGAPAIIRRSRGFVPEPIDLGQDGPNVLATGGHLKATLCVTRGREAFMSQHIGDLNTAQTVRFHTDTARDMLRLLDVTPALVACDLHPDYRSSQFAESTGLPMLRVQHHAAHLAAVAAEHRMTGSVLGVALDGHGQGEAGAAWGGELMLVDGAAWRRVGHLLPLALPGGDRAAREPWRMGIAALHALGRGSEAAQRFAAFPLAVRMAAMLEGGAVCPMTTSMGRLFDAAAALLGLCPQQTCEGQAAMELEALVTTPQCLPAGYRIAGNVLDLRPLLSGLLTPGQPVRAGAELFHGTLIAGLAAWIGQAANALGHTTVVLGGGCLLNRVLADGLANALRKRGLRPQFARAVPTNDGGLSLGQAVMARAHLMTAPPLPQVT
jgi:hydrogenase maturation protein HypF